MHFFKFLTSSFLKHFSLLYNDNYVKMSSRLFCILYYKLTNSKFYKPWCICKISWKTLWLLSIEKLNRDAQKNHFSFRSMDQVFQTINQSWLTMLRNNTTVCSSHSKKDNLSRWNFWNVKYNFRSQNFGYFSVESSK